MKTVLWYNRLQIVDHSVQAFFCIRHTANLFCSSTYNSPYAGSLVNVVKLKGSDFHEIVFRELHVPGVHN